MRPTFILLHVDIHFAQHCMLKRLFFPNQFLTTFIKQYLAVSVWLYFGVCHSTAFIYMWASYLIFPIVNFSALNLLFTFKKQSSWPLIPFPLFLALPPALVQCHLLHLQTVIHSKLSTTPIKWAPLYLHFSTYSNLFSTFQQEWIFLTFNLIIL